MLDQTAKLMLSFSMSFTVSTVRVPDHRPLDMVLGPLLAVITARIRFRLLPGTRPHTRDIFKEMGGNVVTLKQKLS